MAASESKVLALVLARSKAAEGQLICRFFSAWSQWRLRSKLRSEKKTNSLKLEAKSNRWWLPVTFQAWKLQLGTLRWLQRCEDRWKGQKTQSRLRRSWTSWRSLTLSSEVKQRRVLEKQEIKQAAKRLVSTKVVSWPQLGQPTGWVGYGRLILYFFAISIGISTNELRISSFAGYLRLAMLLKLKEIWRTKPKATPIYVGSKGYHPTVWIVFSFRSRFEGNLRQELLIYSLFLVRGSKITIYIY